MPRLEIADLKQFAVVWDHEGVDDYGEVRVKSVPRQLRVRWVNKKRESLRPDGSVVRYDAEVYVDQPIAIGSLMMPGKLGEVNTKKERYRVVEYDEIPDVKGRSVRRVLRLVRQQDAE